MFSRKYIFRWSIFHCYVSLPEGNLATYTSWSHHHWTTLCGRTDVKVLTSGKGSTRTGESLQCCCIQRVNPPFFQGFASRWYSDLPRYRGFSLAFEYDTRYVSSQNLAGVSFIQTSSSRIKKTQSTPRTKIQRLPFRIPPPQRLAAIFGWIPFQFAQVFFPRFFQHQDAGIGGQASKTLPNLQDTSQ